jgi:hypothetical protein
MVRLSANTVKISTSTTPLSRLRQADGSFDRDGTECLFANEPFRDFRSLAIKLMRPVSRFAAPHKACVADTIQQLIVIVPRARQRLDGL